MSKNSLILVLRKENKQNSDMTWQKYKLNLKNILLLEKYFRVVEQFDSTLSSVIDSILGLRCIIHRGTLTDTPSSTCNSVWKNKHFEVSRWLLLKDFDLQSLFHRYVILLSNFFTWLFCNWDAENETLSLSAQSANRVLLDNSIRWKTGNAALCWRERQSLVAITPISVGENANRQSRWRHALKHSI